MLVIYKIQLGYQTAELCSLGHQEVNTRFMQ